MNRGAALGASLLATLASPATWVLGLLAFLVRGGIVVVLLPIVTVPSAVGLGNVLGPVLTDLALGDPLTGALVVGLGGLVVVGGWVIVGGLVAAGAEAEAIRRIAADDDVMGGRPGPPPRRGTAARILGARLIALVPLAVALSIGGVRVVSVAYRELTVPSAGGDPLIWRVVTGSALALAFILVTWLIAEVLGGLAARRIVLAGDGVLRGLSRAATGAGRRPGQVIVGAVVPMVALLGVVIVSGLATEAAWGALRAAVADDATGLVSLLLVAGLVGLWLGGLTLIGLVCAWRGAVWTVQLAGTFGASPTTRPGEWYPDPTSATLSDLRPQGAESDSR